LAAISLGNIFLVRLGGKDAMKEKRESGKKRIFSKGALGLTKEKST